MSINICISADLIIKESCSHLNIIFFYRVSKSVLKKLKDNIKNGKCDISTENAFHIFLLSTDVTFCGFDKTQNILGKTFGMCVIQVSKSS